MLATGSVGSDAGVRRGVAVDVGGPANYLRDAKKKDSAARAPLEMKDRCQKAVSWTGILLLIDHFRHVLIY